MTFKKFFLFLFLTTYAFSSAQLLRTNNDTLNMADGYFKKGDFKKALFLYNTLYKQKPYAYNYFYKIVETHQQLEQYDSAKIVIEDRLKRNRIPVLVVELGYNYQLSNNDIKAQALYNEAINALTTKPNYIYGIGQRFEIHSLLPQAIKAYTKASELLPEKNFSIQLARIYGDLGDVKNMFSSYLDYVAYQPSTLNNIKRNLSQFISENKDSENNKSLRVLLLKYIQTSPDAYWYDLLSWLYVQEKQYNKSFTQEKALYKRNPESLDRIIDLAITAKDDGDTGTATAIFNYIIAATQERDVLLLAHQSLLEIQAKTATKKALDAINEKYLELFKTFGEYASTLALQLSYGQFLAFNYNQPDKASEFLKKAYKLDISPYQEGLVKLRLADILVLQEKFNEALIFYTQIKTSLKNSTLAQEASYKIAKTSYYKGDFEWAESQLKVLKASASQLIANDALDLKLLISDNKWDDSTQTALKYFAKADLLAFQNKTKEAIKIHDKILIEHKDKSIIDETLYQQAKLYESLNQYENAEKNYLKIIADYPNDIFIDDAYYHLAELYNLHLAKPEEAKSLYEKIIFNHEDSIYFVEARKKFRMLRGDAIN